VFQFIRENCPGNQLSRISFVGHSMGGLIIRACLPYLDKYRDKMHGFVTLCTPHLGYMYKTSKLFSTGMWLMRKWKKSTCLSQLGMTDQKDMEQTFLFQLSKAQGLSWFKHVLLVSSYQD
jgi:alpha-beta hydrolase superfamily lysophospholipase